MNNDPFLSSDELRALTKAASSFHQLERLKQMNIPFTVDRYQTPFVTRADYLKFVLSGSAKNVVGVYSISASIFELGHEKTAASKRQWNEAAPRDRPDERTGLLD